MKKKLFTYLSTIALASISLTACSDYLDRRPDDQVTEEETFERFEKANAIVTHVYAQARDLERPIIYFTHFASAGITDECESQFKEDQEPTQFNIGNWSQVQTRGNDWRTAYFAIRQINLFIEGVKKYNTPDDPVTPGNLEKRIGEAHFLRAYLHFLLMKKYGEIPYVTEVIYPGDNMWRTQESVHTVVEKIEADCRTAYSKVNASNANSGTDFGRVDQGACLGLIAWARYVAATPMWNGAKDLYNYPGTRIFENEYSYDVNRWEKAKQAALDVINFTVNGQPRYSLYKGAHGENDFDSGIDAGWSHNGNLVYARLAKMFLMEEENMGLYKTEAVWAVSSWKDGNWTGDIYPPSRGGHARQHPVQEQVDEYECIAKGSDGKYHGYSIFSDEAKAADDGTLMGKYHREAGHKYYDDEDPYVNRDPRFYRDIIYHGTPYTKGYNGEGAYTVNMAEGDDAIGSDNNARTTTGYYFRKFQSDTYRSGASSNYHVTHPTWRLPEFYYMFAEAVVRTQDAANRQKAIDLVNSVRERAFMYTMAPEVATDDNLFLEYIEREWRVEYFYENKRFLRCRWNLEPVQLTEIQKETRYNALGENAAQDYIDTYWTSYPKCQRMINGMKPVEDPNGKIEVNGKKYKMQRFLKETRVFRNQYFLWPIHRDEIRRAQGTLVQNPFWDTGAGE